jgi:hypothetical protein
VISKDWLIIRIPRESDHSAPSSPGLDSESSEIEIILK